MGLVLQEKPRITLPFQQAANPYALPFEPEIWNDLPCEFPENEQRFFYALNTDHYQASVALNIAGLLSLRNLISLVDESEYSAMYSKKSSIRNLLGEEETQKIADLVKLYFSAQQTRANCYAYAINFRGAHPGAKPDPGMKTIEFQHRLYDTYEEAITAGAILDDLVDAGTALPPVLKDHYRVAVLVMGGNKPSFHWLRENAAPVLDDGKNKPVLTWSGKDSHSRATLLDYEGQVVTNPETAGFGDYKFARYFQVPTRGVVPVQFRKEPG